MNQLNNESIRNASKYLFYDTESANCFDGIAKICEVSFIITDRNFNVLHQREITINPRAKFNLKRKGDECHIRYEEDNYRKYRKSPSFESAVPTIQTYFNACGCIPIGFSALDDIDHFDGSYKWAKMISPGFASVDIQPAAQKAMGLPNRPSLGKAVKALCKEEDLEGLHEHWSLHDAMMTMLVTKAVAEKYGSLEAALAECGELAIVDSKTIAKKRESRPFFKIGGKRCRAHSAYKAFEATLDPAYRESLRNPEFAGKRFGLSVATQDMPDSVDLAKELMEKGYYASPMTPLCDVFICVDGADVESMKGKIPREATFVERSKVRDYFR